MELHERFGPLREGEPASYIPELAEVDPDRFAIAAMTIDGERIGVGDVDHTFTIQSISKLLMYGLALETHGRDRVLEKVGVAPTGEAFNAIVLDDDANRAPNPMVNAGAIAITDLVVGDGVDERVEQVRSMYERYLGRKPEIDRAVWASERSTGNRNRAIAYLMLSRGIIEDRVEETLDLYFAQCSVLVTANDLAVIGATIANHGVHPVTGERVVRQRGDPRHDDRGVDVRDVRLRGRVGVLGRDPGEERRGRRDPGHAARRRRRGDVLAPPRSHRQQRARPARVRGAVEHLRPAHLRSRSPLDPLTGSWANLGELPQRPIAVR